MLVCCGVRGVHAAARSVDQGLDDILAARTTIGTFPCIQTCGKEAKKRMCAGCSRSLWTMKEARKNQIAVCVNGAEVSIHNIALFND